MKEKIEGIVISETPYSETSKIINIITKEGIIGLMAKGARNIKNNLRIGTTKLTYGVFYFHKKDDHLSNLISVDVINDFRNIKKNIERISYATYIVELAVQVMKQSHKENIFDLLKMSLEKINEEFDPLVITNILELKYLDYLGVMPIIDGCAICGNKDGIKTLSSYKGGYICKNCLKDDKIVSEKTIKLIRMFYYVDISKIDKLEISALAKLEINNFLDDYYDRYTGLFLKSKSLIKNIKKVG